MECLGRIEAFNTTFRAELECLGRIEAFYKTFRAELGLLRSYRQIKT